MQIKGKDVSGAFQAYSRPVSPTQVPPGAEKQPKKTHPTTDRVDLSETARQLQAARKLLQAVPDIRAEKVARIKQQIENGTYRVDSRKAATCLIEEALLKQSP